MTYTLHDIIIFLEPKKIKSIRLRFRKSDENWVLSYPKFVKQKDWELFLKKNYEWIKAKDQILKNKTSKNNTQLWLFGEQIKLEILELAQPYLFDEKQKTLYLNQSLSEGNYLQSITNFLNNKLISYLEEILPFWESRIGVQSHGIRLKPMKSRWGSCSYRTRKISLNSFLAYHPKSHIEHVLIHELLHFLEPSHNDRFKSLLTHHLPHWKLLDKEMKEFMTNHKFETFKLP
jgi:predicted metal-dependent hydrolase